MNTSMRLLLLLITVIAVQSVSIIELINEEWQTFKLAHNKKYDTDAEETLRIKIFVENRNKIAKHNQRYEKGEASFKMGLNKFADMLYHEFVAIHNGFNKTSRQASVLSKQVNGGVTFISPANVALPSSVDWRTKGAVTPVKDQGHCGSCWAFSATGSLEGQNFRKHGVLVSLSEQNLVDCSGNYGNDGCQGGLMDNAFLYIKDNGGIDTEKSYPYKGENDTCHFKTDSVGASDRGYVDIPKGNEKKLKEAVATIGPISVAIDASQESFQFYEQGVYYEPQCNSEQLDHGVLVVGFGVDSSGENYWLVKNSWGTQWGDNGYIKMARNRENNCGIATQASYPLV